MGGQREVKPLPLRIFLSQVIFGSIKSQNARFSGVAVIGCDPPLQQEGRAG